MIAFSLAPAYLIQTFGLIGIAAIIFAESGLFIGFFLPGDSLLFMAGAIAAGVFASLSVSLSLWVLLPTVAVAAIAGDQVGYGFGNRVGPALFNRPNSRWFHQEHLQRAQVFFDEHGPKALVLARFVPIVRTFTPIVAGASRMSYRSFVTYNVIGGAVWSLGVVLLGYFFGQVSLVRDHIEIALMGVVAVSLIPIGVEMAKSRRKA